MFGIGFAELVLVLVVALLVVGPDKLPGLVKSIAKGYNQLRRAGNDIKRSVTDIDLGDSLAGLGDERDRSASAAPAKVVKPAKPEKTARPGKGKGDADG